MFKVTLIIALIAFGISKYNEKYNCTDDGCPDFYDEIETPVFDEDNIRGDLRDIEKDWKITLYCEVAFTTYTKRYFLCFLMQI